MCLTKRNVIWISPYLPYETVNHAGGKTHYFYLKKLIESDEFNLKLISFYRPGETQKFNIKDEIDSKLFCFHNKGVKKFLRRIVDVNYRLNPFHKYGGCARKYPEIKIVNALKKYKKEGFVPNAIILQWTQFVLFAAKIKKIFPQAKIIGIEEDVTLLSYQRKMLTEKNKISKFIKKLRFKNLEKSEIKCLTLCDLVVVNNNKDLNLLKTYGLQSTVVQFSAYYDNLQDVEANRNSKNVLFYGAMSRPENYLSAVWLLEKVKPLITDGAVKFVILGGSPNACLYKYQGEDVVITGFVDDVKPYFANSLCLAAPLVLGAGIKVKILESLSAGLPVLTNDIGIEGINAVDGRDYLHCVSPEDYAAKINELSANADYARELGKNAKNFMQENFNYHNDAQEFISKLKSLIH